MGKVGKDKIVEFWDWFNKNQSFIIPGKITNEFINILNKKILEFGDFNWEIREGEYKNYMLIISPGGDFDLLEAAHEIINLAPELVDWEYIHYKPSKQWDFTLDIEDTSSSKKKIDVQNWEYVLHKFSNNTFNIIIKVNNLTNFTEIEKLTIADIVLESILGEELSLRLIKKVEILNEFDESDDNNKNSIQILKKHLTQLVDT